MARTLEDAAQVIAQHAGIAPEEIAIALKVIGYQSHTPGLQKILRRAEGMAERFEELRMPCPGLSEVIDCFILAGRLAKHVSPTTDSYSKRTQSINASEDAVFAINDLELGEFQKDLFAISWVIQSVALIQPLQVERIDSTISLLEALQRNLEKPEPAVTEDLRAYPLWERLQHFCTLLGEGEYTNFQYRRLREVLRKLSTLHIAGLQLPTVEARDSIQLRLTERHLTAGHWNFPRPADLESLRSLYTDKHLAESPTRIESLIIFIALATGRDINQALSIPISGESCSARTIGSHQRLVLRKRNGGDIWFHTREVRAEWHILIDTGTPLIWPLPELIHAPLMRLIPKNQEGRLADFLAPTSIPWETRCNDLLAELFHCSHRQANLKVRDFLIRQSYQISGNRAFTQWVSAGRPSNNKENQRSEQISLSAYLNPRGMAAQWAYKQPFNSLLGAFSAIPTVKADSFGNFGVNRAEHENTSIFLREQIRAATENNDLIAQHNTIAIYSLSLLIVATGHRKSNTPFFFSFNLHLEDRLAFIADKCVVGSEARFVPLADTALKQIDAYRQHLQVLVARLKGSNHAVARHISSLIRSVAPHQKNRSISAPTPQEAGLFFQILPDGSIETIRTGQLDELFKSSGLNSRVGLLRKTLADYLWDNTKNGHLVAALLGHANDYHPFGPASAWTIADWSNEISPLIETYLTERKWEVLESPLAKYRSATELSMLSVAGLQTTSQSYEGRIKERQSAQTRARLAIKAVLTDELLEDNDYRITNKLRKSLCEQIKQLLVGDSRARKAVSTQLDYVIGVLKDHNDEVNSPVGYMPSQAESPIKISFSRYLSNATEFRKCWIQLVGSPIVSPLDTVERLAQLAICLVVFDGVLDPKRIKASIDSVISGTGISDHVDTISIRSCVETRDHEFDAMTIPGDLSTAFILGLEAELQKPSPSYLPSIDQVLDRVEEVLRKIYGRTAKVSLELLCDIFKPWWLIRLPGAIYSIAIGQHNGPCPNPPSEISLFASREPELLTLVEN